MPREATARRTRQRTTQRKPAGSSRAPKVKTATRRLKAPVTAVATLTSKGQITIPKAVRDQYGLRTGDQVGFIEDDHGFRLVRYRAESPFAKWQGYLKDWAGTDVDALIEDWRGR